MNVKDLSVAITGIIVMLLVTTTILVPIVASGLTIAGDPVYYENEGDLIFKKANPGDVVSFESTISDGTTTTKAYYNGVESDVNPFVTGETEVVLYSDGAYIRNGGTANSNGLMTAYKMQSNVVANVASYTTSLTVTITFDSTTISATKSVDGGNATEYFTVPYTWAFITCPSDLATHKFVSLSRDYGQAYINDLNDVVFCGEYATGTLDTLYSYYNGVGKAYKTGYELSVVDSLVRVEGTTDVYLYTPTISITDGNITETYVPYKCLVPLDVEGHKDSGVSYTLLSVLPIFVVIGIIMGVMALLFNRRT